SDRDRTVKARRVTRFDAAQQALWICGQRKEALPTSSTRPTTAENRSGQLMCYQNRTSPSATDRRRACLSQAHELSGLGSTRVVRFYCLRRSRDDEPDSVATGPQDAEVSGYLEPLGARRTFDDGGGRTAGHVGAAVPTLSRSLRGRRDGGAGRPAAGQAIAAAGAGAGVAAAAGSVPGLLSGLEREAFSRTSGARPQLAVGLH